MGTRCTAAPEKPDHLQARLGSARTLGAGGWGLVAGKSRAPNPEPQTANPKSQIPNPVVYRDSSMARRAARELLNLILGDEPASQLQLIRRRRVIDAEHGVARAHVALRVAVAVDAPFHLQRLLLPHERHAIDLSVAGRAADALVQMDAVVEVHEIGQVVHARPLDRLIRSKALAHRLEKRAGGKDLRVAVHARSGRWDPGEGRLLDRRVAVAAVDPVDGDV